MRPMISYRHQGPKLNNPFYAHQKKGVSKRIKIDIFLLILCCFFWTYFLFFSPFFAIKQINIAYGGEYKDKKLIEEQINTYFESANFFSLSRINYLLFSEQKLRLALNENFFIKSVNAQKNFPNQILVTVTRMEPKFILKTPYEIAYLDSSGIILEKEAPNASSTAITNRLPTLIIGQDSELNIKEKVFNEEFLQFIDKFESLFFEKKFGLEIDSFEVKDTKQIQGTVKVKLKNSGLLYINDSLPPENQIENFATVYKEKIKPQNKAFEYLDLRFGDKVYIK